MNAIKLTAAAAILVGMLAMFPATANAACGIRGGGTCGALHSSTAYWILACPAGVVSAAMVKNWKRHKELNTQEAWTCGLLYWWNEATGQYGG